MSIEAAGRTTMTHADQLELLVDAVEEYAIFMLAPDGRVVTWNAGARRIKGYTAHEIVGKHFRVFYPPEDIAAGKPESELAQALKSGQCQDEGWRLRKDGSRFWANVVITAVVDQDGRPEGFAKITRDDTDRRRAEEQVRRLELLTERERIAGQLHEQIVHRIFGAGLALESSLQFIHDASAERRIQDAVEMLDEAVKEIRAVALGLRETGTIGPAT